MRYSLRGWWRGDVDQKDRMELDGGEEIPTIMRRIIPYGIEPRNSHTVISEN